MALVINDRVKETSTTTGTGALTFAGATSGFETFSAGIGNSNTTYYAIVNTNTPTEWEVGLGTLAGDSSTITRTTPISSSNSDSAVDFGAGTKEIFCTLPASKAIIKNASGYIDSPSVTQLDIVAQGDLRLQDTTGGDYIAHQASGSTVTYTVTWPAGIATADGQALKSTTGGVLSWGTAGTAWVGLKTAGYTAAAGEGVLCDTADTAAFTVTLPAAPSLGDEVSIVDAVGNAGTDNITVGRNSLNIQGAAADLVISTNNAAIKLVYSDATNGWRLANND